VLAEFSLLGANSISTVATCIGTFGVGAMFCVARSLGGLTIARSVQFPASTYLEIV
jgi:hypothetical protein